mgnify:CR=1 FL=1
MSEQQSKQLALEPCPMWGCSEILRFELDLKRIQCRECGVSVERSGFYPEIEWNTRAPHPDSERVAALGKAFKVRHQWKPQNRGYKYARFVCTVCDKKSDIDDPDELCGVGAQDSLIEAVEATTEGTDES